MTPDEKDEVSVTVDKQIYRGWTGVSVKIGIRSISGAFDLSVTDDWTKDKSPWPMAPGSPCTVKIGSDVAITGYVDEVDVEYDRQQHTIRIGGRDKASDLVDCSADSSDGKFKNITLATLAKKLASPFGVSVIDNFRDTYSFPYLHVGPGDSCFEVIDRAARLRACLIYSDGLGDLVLGKPGTSLCRTALVEGKNILKATSRFSAKDRHSVYQVKSQMGGFGKDVSVSTAMGIIASVKDLGVTRYRPLEFMAETNTDTAGALRRANWEASTRRGKSQPITVIVDGHRQGDGSLWRPNTLVQVVSPLLGLAKATNLLIIEVDYVQNLEEGTVTSLELAPADSMRILQTKESAQDLYKNYGRDK